MGAVLRKTAAFLFLLGLLLSCSGGGDGGGGVSGSASYTLTVSAVSGRVSVSPAASSYASGTQVMLTATPDSGYDFDRWSGDSQSRENPLVITMDGNKTITANFTTVYTATYYVDFEGGNDAESGLSSTSAWKHAPGDSQATGNAKNAQMGPGVRILFKGGVVYRGNISIPSDGSLNNPVLYKGDAWPGLSDVKAVIDGGDPVTGWLPCPSAAACNGNPNYASLYYAYVPGTVDPLSVNLHEYNAATSEDAFLWPSQTPNPVDPYFYDDRTGFLNLPQSRLTRTTLTDPAVFNSVDAGYWNDSYLLVWVNPNVVVTRKITGFEPSLNRVTFEDIGANAIYPDGRDQSYAIFNSSHAVDRAGEYFISTTPDNQNRLKILLWPGSASNLDMRITRSVRTYGFNINSRSNITIEGFIVRKLSGTGLTDAVGIGDVTLSYMANYNIRIRNNLIAHNRKGGSSTGYGGVYLAKCYNCLIEENVITDNPRNSGIFAGGGARITAKNNTIIRAGSTSLRYYTVDYGIIEGNVIRESNGSHANGITMYLGCNNILVASNRVYDSASPITFQDSGNLYFINNIIDAADRESNVNEWADTSNGPWVRGTIAFFNNTIVRNSRNASLNIGDNPDVNTYLVFNNIIDGGGSDARSHNIYTGLAWNQAARYGWSLKTGEFVQENLSLLFADAANADFSLIATSPARAAGIDITPYFPATIFPDFDFRKDITGKTRTVWDVGAYAY